MLSDPQTIVKNITALWSEHFQNCPDNGAFKTFIQQSGLLHQIKQGNIMTVVFSFADLSILHISESAAAYFGGTISEITRQGASYIVSCFEESQLKFAVQQANANVENTKVMDAETLTNSYACFVNWVIHAKDAVKRRAIFRIFSLQLNDMGMPMLGMYIIHDIAPFIKENIWWYRSQAGQDKYEHYHSEEGRFHMKDLLSKREKFILVQLASGKSSKEIAGELNLSSHTIDNHRRRLLAKTGAVDTSSLVHIARLSGLL
jgi:DNA-binding CsgD family transcriptional regulator